MKDRFPILKKLLHKDNQCLLPSHTKPKELADRFADYFSTKIVTIRGTIQPVVQQQQDTPGVASTSSLSAFEEASEEEIKKLVMGGNSKSSPLDPLPTWLLKKCPSLIKVLTCLVNSSITSGQVPSLLKQAQVTPLLKKPPLDVEVLKNFRPVSYLSYVSKLIEEVVLER